jgi:hypothetical protein
MPPQLRFDDRLWPKVRVTWPSQAVTDEEFVRALDQISGYTARAQAYVIVHDARQTVRPSPKQRALAAERQKRDAEASRRWLKGAAIVVPSPILAGVVTAINWVFPSPYPQKICSRIEDAETWVDAQLRKR